MAFSGSISGTQFNALKVVDHAFRRCRLPAQAITAEMQEYALESLYVFLSQLANPKPPSWCIEKVILPMYYNQPIVTLPIGTVEVLNLNYRVVQLLSGASTTTANAYTTNFTTATTVTTVGIKWAGTAVSVLFEASDDGLVWEQVGSSSATASAGEITWTDISQPRPFVYFRVRSLSALNFELITLGNLPQEIPLGALNRDTYAAQSNKYFPNRPNSYWFQRDLPQPVVNLWPAPFAQSEQAQLILWRHRQIMDTENLQQDVEVPQRWLEAIIDGLAFRVATETPTVDINLIPVLEQRAARSVMAAWDGDNDGSPTFINPGIGCYTK